MSNELRPAHISKTHYGDSQRSANIYVAHSRLPAGAINEGCWTQWVISLTIAGACQLKTDGQERLLQAGDLLLLRPQTWHTILVSTSEDGPERNNTDTVAGSAWEVVYAVFHPRPHWHLWLDSIESRQGVAVRHFSGKARDEMVRDVLNIWQTYAQDGLLREERALGALDNALISLYAHSERVKSARDSRVQDAIEFIYTAHARPLGVSDIAQFVGLSASRFSALFVSEMGVGPAEYLERLRLARAAEMLLFSRVAVTEVAHATGYLNPGYFAQRFRREYGLSPREYRDANRPTEARYLEYP